jgi:hypothetical protein
MEGMSDRSARDSNGGGNDHDCIDLALRERVTESFAGLLTTLDAALTQPTPKMLDKLQADADRTMRAVARIWLEIQRVADERDR